MSETTGVLRSEVRPGAYADSVVLMQLQAGLAGLDGVIDAAAVMATPTNLELLDASGMRPEETGSGPDDLLLVVRAEDDDAATAALARVDELLSRRRETVDDAYRPKSLDAAVRLLPAARWVLISVPGRYAAEVTRQAIERERHVFLYSDNVPLADEVQLKQLAAERGLLVLGPDCGTAIVGGAGLGFANRVRPGSIGLLGASGTGIQSISSRVHALGAGLTHAIGTGGRDLSAEVGAATALAGLDLLRRDPATRVIVLVSKPPASEVAARLLGAARAAGKPVVVCFLGWAPPARRLGPLRFASGLDDAAALAVAALDEPEPPAAEPPLAGRLRGLFAGGTLAQEVVQGLSPFLTPLHANLHAPGVAPLADPGRSRDHTVIDLGADEYTQGRLHPMLDPTLRIERLRQEAADPETGLILLDLVLGDGAHPDPAAELAAAVAETARPGLELAALVVGTEEDPQDADAQADTLRQAGVAVFDTVTATLEHVLARLSAPPDSLSRPIDAAALEGPLAAINIGLESFHDSLAESGVEVVQVEWRPPAGGNNRLRAILDKLR
ncbi:MAG: acyl-CoA synthetase FdrA [Thermoanaerobaculia bacterium]